jgi:hypothetical protein
VGNPTFSLVFWSLAQAGHAKAISIEHAAIRTSAVLTGLTEK